MVDPAFGNYLKRHRRVVGVIHDYPKCELCSNQQDNRNGEKLCTSCMVKVHFAIEELRAHGELLGVKEYVELQKMANELGKC